MASFKRIVLTVVIAATATTVVGDAHADATLREVQELFRLGWSTSFKDRASADNQFEAVKQVAAGNLDAYYAHSLVLIKQRRYQEAAKLLDDLVRADSGNVHYLRAKAWLDALTKNYESSLLTLDRLGQQVAELDEKLQTQRRELSGFLGRMLGFLEGPVGNSSTQATVAASKAKIVARLTPEEQSVLQDECRGVMVRYKLTIADYEAAEEEARQDAEDQRDQLLEDLERQRQRMDDRKKDLAPEREKLREEAQSELDQLIKEEQPLLQQFRQLEQQATIVRRELLLLTGEIFRLQSYAERQQDPSIRLSLLNESSRLSLLTRRYDVDLLALERRASSINQQRAEIRSRAQQAQQRYAAEFGQIDTELADIAKQERRNELEERKEQRSRITGKTRVTRAMAAKAAALGTYEDFPLEAEKQRVLAALK